MPSFYLVSDPQYVLLKIERDKQGQYFYALENSMFENNESFRLFIRCMWTHIEQSVLELLYNLRILWKIVLKTPLFPVR